LSSTMCGCHIKNSPGIQPSSDTHHATRLASASNICGVPQLPNTERLTAPLATALLPSIGGTALADHLFVDRDCDRHVYGYSVYVSKDVGLVTKFLGVSVRKREPGPAE
jgi:hypothetical protein